jgi:hypothetical protein
VFRLCKHGHVAGSDHRLVIVENEPLIGATLLRIRQISFIEIVGVENDGIAGVQQTSVVRQETICDSTSGVFERRAPQSEFEILRAEIGIPKYNLLEHQRMMIFVISLMSIVFWAIHPIGQGLFATNFAVQNGWHLNRSVFLVFGLPVINEIKLIVWI